MVHVFLGLEFDAFSPMPGLHALKLAGNKLSQLNHGSLDSLHNLERLDFSYNRLTKLPKVRRKI